jgi:RNA polymerase sigma-70 factor, ECF subfamily
MPINAGSHRDPVRAGPLAPEDTIDLLALVKQGDDEARNRLVERCIPPLRRWARGRLPLAHRGMLETADLVQDAVMAAIGKLQAFESRHQGALQAYLRQAVKYRISDLIRKGKRRPRQTDLNGDVADEQTSPLDRLIGARNVERYEEALAQLRPEDREAIIGRMEMQYSYAELAVVLDKPTAEAARLAVTRAMKQLASRLAEGPSHG